MKYPKHILAFTVVGILLVISSSGLVRQLGLLMADSINVSASVPPSILGSTPTIYGMSSTCNTVTWSDIIPINDAENPFTTAEYKLEISGSNGFDTLLEMMSYRHASSYVVAYPLVVRSTYYYRLIARDPARPSEISYYSPIVRCTVQPEATGSGGGGAPSTTPIIIPSNEIPTTPAAPEFPAANENGLNWIDKTFVQPILNPQVVPPLKVVPADLAPKATDLTFLKEALAKQNYKLVDPASLFYVPAVDKPGTASLNLPKDSRNVTAAFYNENTKVWEKIPVHFNDAKDQIQMKSNGDAVYAIIEIQDAPAKFLDVKKTAWYYDYAENARLMSIITRNGNGLFNAEAPITHSDALSMINQAFGVTAKKEFYVANPLSLMGRGEAISAILSTAGIMPVTEGRDRPFTDISWANPFYGYIVTAKNENIIHGYADGTFQSNNAINKAEFSKILTKALEVRYIQYTKKAVSKSVTMGSTNNPQQKLLTMHSVFQKFLTTIYAVADGANKQQKSTK